MDDIERRRVALRYFPLSKWRRASVQKAGTAKCGWKQYMNIEEYGKRGNGERARGTEREREIVEEGTADEVGRGKDLYSW